MIPVRTEEMKSTLAAPAGYESSCAALPVLFTKNPDGQVVIVSAWMPTEKELKDLNEGKPVLLFVYGVTHPMVALGVMEVEPCITKN